MLGFSPLSAAPLASTGVSGEQYNFSVNAGTFTTTGQAANFQIAVSIDLQAGLFTLSLQGAAKLITESVPDGQFAVTGQPISFGFRMGAANGSFTLTGQDVSIRIGDQVETEEFFVTGQPISFGFGMGAVNGSFTLTGQDITEDISDSVAAGSFTLTGQDLTLVQGITVSGLSVKLELGVETVYGLVVPNQLANYSNIVPSQTPNYSAITPSQTPNYSAITPSQTPSYSAITPSQSPNWSDLA